MARGSSPPAHPVVNRPVAAVCGCTASPVGRHTSTRATLLSATARGSSPVWHWWCAHWTSPARNLLVGLAAPERPGEAPAPANSNQWQCAVTRLFSAGRLPRPLTALPRRQSDPAARGNALTTTAGDETSSELQRKGDCHATSGLSVWSDTERGRRRGTGPAGSRTRGGTPSERRDRGRLHRQAHRGQREGVGVRLTGHLPA